MAQCEFVISWAGRCRAEAGAEPMCGKHAAMLCASCGEQATHDCDHTGQFVCGAPLCDVCEGSGGDGSNGLGWGFHGHVHVRKAAATTEPTREGP